MQCEIIFLLLFTVCPNNINEMTMLDKEITNINLTASTKPLLIIVTGPTAVGKTAVSVQLAKKINGEIISADSMQVYRHMDIGTAKVTKEEMCGVPHYMIDEYEPDEEFDVTVFKTKAREYISKITSDGKIPIIAGGTGFYIQSVLYDVAFEDYSEEEKQKLHEELTSELEKKGPDAMFEMLKEVDSEYAGIIHKNNIRRVLHGIEFYRLTGKKLSKHNEEQHENESPYNFLYFVIRDERDRLYDRINKRVDKMLEEGLVDEVKALMDKGLSRELPSMLGLGYKEIADYLSGECILDEAVELIKRDTRHFAKKQMTWFKRERNVIYIDRNDKNNESIVDEIILKIKGYLGE